MEECQMWHRPSGVGVRSERRIHPSTVVEEQPRSSLAIVSATVSRKRTEGSRHQETAVRQISCLFLFFKAKRMMMLLPFVASFLPSLSLR